jgi:hypothetical protein
MRKLIDATLVASAGEVGVEKGGDAGLGHIAADEAGAKGEDVGVIMLTGKLGREGIVDAGAAARGFAINGDRNPDSGPAHGDSAFGIPGGYGPGEARAKLGIINAFGPIGAKVGYVMAALAEPANEFVFERVAGMVGGESDAHGD